MSFQDKPRSPHSFMSGSMSLLIFLNSKSPRIIYELQRKIIPEWLERTKQRYSKDDLIIVPLEKLPTKIEELRVELEKYLI